MGESVTEGTILEWTVKVGDAVEDDETIVEISTDKVDMELPAPAGGHDHRDPRRGGETVTVGQVIAGWQVGAGRRRGQRRRARRQPAPRRPPAASAPSPTDGQALPRRPRASPPPRAST